MYLLLLLYTLILCFSVISANDIIVSKNKTSANSLLFINDAVAYLLKVVAFKPCYNLENEPKRCMSLKPSEIKKRIEAENNLYPDEVFEQLMKPLLKREIKRLASTAGVTLHDHNTAGVGGRMVKCDRDLSQEEMQNVLEELNKMEGVQFAEEGMPDFGS